MAYNNMFPIGYQPAVYYPQLQQQPLPQPSAQTSTQMPSQPTNNSIIWVSGEAGAKAYLVAPNTTVQLWDSEDQVVYLKSADASGMPSMKILDYKIRENGQPTAPIAKVPAENYVTREEFNAFEEKIRKQLDRNRDRKENRNE